MRSPALSPRKRPRPSNQQVTMSSLYLSFFSGYLAVMEAKKASVSPVMAWHLQELIGDVELYGWAPTRAFHAMWFQQLEHSRVNWLMRTPRSNPGAPWSGTMPQSLPSRYQPPFNSSRSHQRRVRCTMCWPSQDPELVQRLTSACARMQPHTPRICTCVPTGSVTSQLY